LDAPRSTAGARFFEWACFQHHGFPLLSGTGNYSTAGNWYCCHRFRAAGITAYLENGGTLEHAQQNAAHESPRTTKLYDRTSDQITLDEIERIAI